MSDITAPLGPLFGPDFVLITVNDATGQQYQLQVYPDANNIALKSAGIATQYYFQPSRVYLAKKQDAPADFDFGMTVFKGLMTSEDTLGVAGLPTSGGQSEAGGGFCTFSTTFAIPETVIANVINILKSHTHTPPVPRIAGLFNFTQNDPDPLLGMVDVIANDVLISIPDLKNATGQALPMFISAQGSGKGSIEAQGFSSFLVTCNQFAAGAIAGSLMNGVSPFIVACNLKEQFYINGVTVIVTVDADKSYDQFSAAVSIGGFLGIDSATFNYAYSNMLTSGAIVTDYSGNEGVLSDAMKKMIDDQVDQMRKAALDAIKTEIFDWNPTQDTPASTDRGIFSEVFGGSSVSLKASYQHRGLKFSQTVSLNETITLNSNIMGDINDLLPAVKANVSKYLAIVDIGNFFQKIQIAGRSSIVFSETLADGTNLHDPIQSVQLQASYPDFDTPVGQNNQPNLKTLANGFHYTIGQMNPGAAGELAIWTKDNASDIINIAFLRLAADLPIWPANQVQITTTLVYDPSDPRVELSNGGTTISQTLLTQSHTPIISPEQVGYLFVRFASFPILPKDNIVLTLTCTIGSRTDIITINRANQKNAIWEIYSDKYSNITSFQYTVQVQVAGPNFTDPVVQWQSPNPITVSLPPGRLKYIKLFSLSLPPAASGQLATINSYIANYPLTPAS